MGEFIDSGENLRVRKPEVLFFRSHKKKKSKRPVAGSYAVLQVGLTCLFGKSIRAIKSLPLVYQTYINLG